MTKRYLGTTPPVLDEDMITKSYVDTQLSGHNSDTTSVHGIADTSNIALKTGNINQFADITSAGANIEDAVTKRHSQNTDSGTSSSTFYIGTGGPKLKNDSGNFLLRNNADDDYVTLTADMIQTVNKFSYSDGTDEKAYMEYNSDTDSIDFVFV